MAASISPQRSRNPSQSSLVISVRELPISQPSNPVSSTNSPYMTGQPSSSLPSILTNMPPPRRQITSNKIKVTTRAIPVNSPADFPKARILPTIRNIGIFSALGTGFIVACIALVMLQHPSFWITLAASFCGVIGAVLYIEVALLISARFRCKILDEECHVEDQRRSSGQQGFKEGWSWDLRKIPTRKKGEETAGCTDCTRNASTNQSPKSGSQSMASISEEVEEENDSRSEKTLVKDDDHGEIQVPPLAATVTSAVERT